LFEGCSTRCTEDVVVDLHYFLDDNVFLLFWKEAVIWEVEMNAEGGMVAGRSIKFSFDVLGAEELVSWD